jgi:ATP-binding cassette, subfamily B, bacterial
MSASEFAVQLNYVSDHRSPIRWVTSHALRHKWIVVMMIIGAFGNAAFAAVPPRLVGLAFNAILLPKPDFSILGWVAVWITISQTLRAILQLGRNFGNELIGQRLERDARAELYSNLLGKSMTFHGLRPLGDIMARATNDVREINLMVNPGINLVVGSGMFMMMPVIVGATIHWSLFFVPLLFNIAYFTTLYYYLREMSPVTDSVRSNFGSMNAGLNEALEGIEVVKGAAQEPQEIDRFERNAKAYRDATVRQGNIEARFLVPLFLGLTEAGGFLHALLLFHAGLIGIGDVVSFVVLLQLFGFPSFSSLFAYSQVAAGMSSARRILTLINSETELDENKEGYSAPIKGALEFRNVSFGYGAGKQALNNVSFKVQPGQTVAIVGQTGAGKSTLSKLVNRIYEATSGEILIDGVNVRDWQLESLRQQISIIEQDVFLFSRTVAENIAFGAPGATQEEIERAAKDAQAHDFIMGFKDGYQTIMGERGVTLSGGQRQRLALARAFLTKPSILILDDSTSAIDSATEDEIQRAIERAAEGRTTLLITHRLSQIRWADQIVVLRNGQVSAMGDHETLLKISEPYRRIFARYEALGM